jgi:hypothetical protein
VEEVLAELSLQNPVTTEPHEMNEIAQILYDVEVLYILAPKPLSLNQLVNRLKTTFGLETNPIELKRVLDLLDSRRVVRMLSNYSSDNTLSGVSQESFCVTPLGLSTFGRSLEALAEITLTMQLGLEQRVVVAEE